MVFAELLQRFLVTESTPEQAGRATNKTIRNLDNRPIITPDEKFFKPAPILANKNSNIQ